MIRHLWFRFKRNFFSSPLAVLGKYGMKAILLTCRVEVKGLAQFIETASKQKCMLMVWHNRIAMICEFFHHYAPQIRYTAFLSNSRDGEPIARLLKSYPGSSCIRVSHDARHLALRSMISRLKSSGDIVIITPDGPRGPRYKVKKGIVAAAKESEAAIIPFTWEANRYWQFNTWDRFRIPQPFSKISIILGNPIHLQNEIETELAIQQLEDSMREAQHRKGLFGLEPDLF